MLCVQPNCTYNTYQFEPCPIEVILISDINYTSSMMGRPLKLPEWDLTKFFATVLCVQTNVHNRPLSC